MDACAHTHVICIFSNSAHSENRVEPIGVVNGDLKGSKTKPRRRLTFFGFPFSIELEKQKAEHDRMIKIAEEKKQVNTKSMNLNILLFLEIRRRIMPCHCNKCSSRRLFKSDILTMDPSLTKCFNDIREKCINIDVSLKMYIELLDE